MQLFYNPNISTETKSFSFDKEESRHIVRVLRKNTGDELLLTNGREQLFWATVVLANDKKCVADISKWEARPKTWDYELHIAMAPTKMNDRFEWFLEKATEIGIDEITPLFCDHSERKQVKMERMEKVVIAAMKQSLKFKLPKINEPVKFKDFIVNKDWDLGLIAHCQEDDKKHLQDLIREKKKIMILIGPEGDFSKREIEEAISLEISPISLGESRLRTETAGVVACNNIAILKEIL
jgi:16S rRNA (uracil1498-N3)-methyltransferase